LFKKDAVKWRQLLKGNQRDVGDGESSILLINVVSAHLVAVEKEPSNKLVTKLVEWAPRVDG